MKKRKDLAISFTEADRDIAERVGRHLEKLGISYYYYKDVADEQFGESLTEIIDAEYRNARFVLLLLSEAYYQKEWTQKELETALDETAQRKRRYILPVRIGETELKGLPADIIHYPWDDQPERLASFIQAKVGKKIAWGGYAAALAALLGVSLLIWFGTRPTHFDLRVQLRPPEGCAVPQTMELVVYDGVQEQRAPVTEGQAFFNNLNRGSDSLWCTLRQAGPWQITGRGRQAFATTAPIRGTMQLALPLTQYDRDTLFGKVVNAQGQAVAQAKISVNQDTTLTNAEGGWGLALEADCLTDPLPVWVSHADYCPQQFRLLPSVHQPHTLPLRTEPPCP